MDPVISQDVLNTDIKMETHIDPVAEETAFRSMMAGQILATNMETLGLVIVSAANGDFEQVLSSIEILTTLTIKDASQEAINFYLDLESLPAQIESDEIISYLASMKFQASLMLAAIPHIVLFHANNPN